jgi:hypothetical protein
MTTEMQIQLIETTQSQTMKKILVSFPGTNEGFIIDFNEITLDLLINSQCVRVSRTWSNSTPTVTETKDRLHISFLLSSDIKPSETVEE